MSVGVPELSGTTVFTAVREIAVGRGAISALAVSADGALLTATHRGDDSVSLIDVAAGAVTLTVTDIEEPSAVALCGRRAYIGSVSAAYDEVLAFDTDSESIVAAYPVDFGITDIAVSPDGRYVYASRTGADDAGGADVTVLDTATGAEKSVAIAAPAVGSVRVSPDGRTLYAAANSAASAELVVVETRRARVAGAVGIGSPIRDVALSPDGATAYVASCGPDFGTVLDVIDTRTRSVAATHKIGDIAGAVAQLSVSRDGERAYLVGDQQVTVLSTATMDVIGAIAVGDAPSYAVESPDGQLLYVADYAGTVTTLEISAADRPTTALTSDDEWTAPRGWSFSDLLRLQLTPA